MAKLEQLDKQDVENIVSDAVDNAVDFVESEIALHRIKAQRYFDGETDLGHEEGRSKVVSTKVRDTIRNIKPSLLRIFMSNERVVEFVPKGPEDVGMSEQATDYINWAFAECGGYRLLNEAFHDALVKKQGVMKIWWDESEKGEIYTYDNLTDEEYQILMSEPDIEIIEHSEERIMMPNPMAGQPIMPQGMTPEMMQGMSPDMMQMQPEEIEQVEHSVKIMRRETEGKLKIDCVPPEEFFVDRNATCLEDAYVVAHRTEMRVGDLVAMGYDFDEVSELDSLSDGSTSGDIEIYERKGYIEDNTDESQQDPSMKLVVVTEAYMRIDVEGTGIPMLYKVTCGGTDYQVLDYELWDEIPFAVFECDPEPHSFYGTSVAELVLNDQDATTSIIRGILDNVALTNNPRVEVMDDMVNIDDVLNNEVGAIIRSRQIGSVQPLAVPFVAGSTLPMLQYMDQLTEVKTGVSRASLGLDPDTMQNTSATAAKIAQNGAQGQIEVIARNLAESGMKRLFKLMLKLFVKNSNEQQMMRMNGQFVPVDPRVWDTSMDTSVNVGLGTGQEDIKLATLSQALQIQMQLATMPSHLASLTSMTQIRNTLADMLALGGYRNAERYFVPMNPQQEQMIMQQVQQQQAMQAQQAAQQGNPAMAQAQAILQAEQIKAQAKMQTDSAKMQLQAQTDAAKIQAQQEAKLAELQYRRQTDLEKMRLGVEEYMMGDDLQRDKMAQDLVLEASKILAQYGTQVDLERIRMEQSMPRNSDGNIQ